MSRSEAVATVNAFPLEVQPAIDRMATSVNEVTLKNPRTLRLRKTLN